jgi:hypothetical protein
MIFEQHLKTRETFNAGEGTGLKPSRRRFGERCEVD